MILGGLTLFGRPLRGTFSFLGTSFPSSTDCVAAHLSWTNLSHSLLLVPCCCSCSSSSCNRCLSACYENASCFRYCFTCVSYSEFESRVDIYDFEYGVVVLISNVDSESIYF